MRMLHFGKSIAKTVREQISRHMPGRSMSLFTKSVVALILIGLLPLVIMSMIIYNASLGSLQTAMLSNMYRTTLTIGRNIESLLSEMEEDTKYLYSARSPDYGYIYQLLENDSVSSDKKATEISDMLRNILYMNQYIDHVFLVLPDGEVCSAMHAPERIINESLMLEWHKENYQEDSREMQVHPVHIVDYYMGTRSSDFTVSRNIMNTSTIENASSEILGTLYIDISEEYLDSIINETRLEEGSQIYIVDKSLRQFAYNPYPADDDYDESRLLYYVDDMDSRYQYINADGDYFIYSEVPGTDWLIVERISSYHLRDSYQAIRNMTLLIIGISTAVLVVIYYFYSKKSSQPIRNLADAMESIEQGNLTTRVDIQSNDEIGYLAQGLNSMTENLQSHIRKVYIAEIRQRDAEIEALKTQIQPHYLYNTLDVIRMMAVTHDDRETAEMIDGLSGQLKYLMGSARDMVTLRDEIESVRNYFKIIRIRYENRFSLEINVEDDMMDLRVPQLILQPVVENAVKHGLKEKEGEGVVAIQAQMSGEGLEITVMDNGAGMTKERLEYVRNLLESHETENHPRSKRASIGIKNVYDRIRLIFGDRYHIEISSFEGIGTIVKYRLPVIKADSAGGEKSAEETERNAQGGKNV